jgi:alkylation response protein AidB-like acyl-CoA dehydrogenase
VDRVAFVDSNQESGTRIFRLFTPFVEVGRGQTVGLFDARVPALTCADGVVESTVGLLGFPQGELRTYSVVTNAHLGRPVWGAHQLARLVRGELALVAGLIAGVTRRLVDESYAYAKMRQSEGRAIVQHQAVALRLADLAIHQQALALYLTGCAERCEVCQLAGDLATASEWQVAELAFRIARDAVQIAAGHGYVEGLPFRRLFEQVRTLSSAFAMVRKCAAVLVQEASIDRGETQ